MEFAPYLKKIACILKIKTFYTKDKCCMYI